ncbi:unnamed protein product [Agarophyton chilense]
MAFLPLRPPPIVRQPNHTRSVTCEHRDCRKSSTLPPIFSAAVAAVVSFPLLSGERGGDPPSYGKIAPTVLTAAVATSLWLRRKKTSRTLIPRSQSDTSTTENRLDNERQNTVQDESKRSPGFYDGSREEWSVLEGRTASTFPSGTREEQLAVGMDTTSLFSHMRAEFNAVPLNEQEGSPSQGPYSSDSQKKRHSKSGRSIVSDIPERENNQQSFLQHPASISGPDVVRWFLRAPVFILTDVIVPVAQVSSILWFDCKQWILGKKNREEQLYFIEDSQQAQDEFDSVQNWEELDVDLTEEERQLRNIQNNVQAVVVYAQKALRNLIK